MNLQKVTLFGMTYSNATLDDVCRFIDARVADRSPAYIVTPNVDHVCRYQYDEQFRQAYREAALVLADGTPIVWCSRLLGCPLTQKLSGSDLVPLLSRHAAVKGYSVFLFGAAPGVAAAAADRLKGQFEGLRIAGTYSPPMGFEKDELKREEAIEQLRAANADLCFLALGSPKQEYWMNETYRVAETPVLIGVGAGIDFAAGRLSRAPVWMRSMGLEWLFRLALEPRRLWRRYLVENAPFLRIVLREIVRRRKER